MNAHERDTHFAGFAKLLWSDMRAMMDVDPMGIEGDLAQSLYDFAVHVVENTEYSFHLDRQQTNTLVEKIPDFTAWPGEI